MLLSAVRALWVDVYRVPSGSMEPALMPGDRIAVLTSPWQRDVERGDVVVFDGRGSLSPESPDSPLRTLVWILGRNDGDVYVKRIVALPGERVSCDGRDGPLLVNGARVQIPGGDRCGEQRFDTVIPAQRIWLMGDNRSDSRDSRDLLGAPGGGAVPESRVIGRVIWLAR